MRHLQKIDRERFLPVIGKKLLLYPVGDISGKSDPSFTVLRKNDGAPLVPISAPERIGGKNVQRDVTTDKALPADRLADEATLILYGIKKSRKEGRFGRQRGQKALHHREFTKNRGGTADVIRMRMRQNEAVNFLDTKAAKIPNDSVRDPGLIAPGIHQNHRVPGMDERAIRLPDVKEMNENLALPHRKRITARDKHRQKKRKKEKKRDGPDSLTRDHGDQAERG